MPTNLRWLEAERLTNLRQPCWRIKGDKQVENNVMWEVKWKPSSDFWHINNSCVKCRTQAPSMKYYVYFLLYMTKEADEFISYLSSCNRLNTHPMTKRTYPAINLAKFKFKSTGMHLISTTTVWYFVISMTTICSIPPISVVDDSTTLVLCWEQCVLAIYSEGRSV